jgi:hypothetical protein
MTVPVIANQVFVACILIDPTNDTPYRVGNADTASVLPIPNYTCPVGCTLINPVTGIPYH